MEKENKNKTGLTAADIIKSDIFKNAMESHLTRIREKIKDVRKTLKTGERLRRTPAVRLHELGLLETEAFIDAYTCIVAKQPIDLPATLRNAIKEEGDYIFVSSYAKMNKKN